MLHPVDILKKYWGHDGFRPGQQEIIETLLNSEDALALLPTGGGKSICFQIPGLMREGVTVVISPLIALMHDQVQNLKKIGIRAASLDSTMGFSALDAQLDNAVYGGLDFIYVSPERIKTDLFKERFKKMKVAMIAVDEAHCVSQWGYDFRPPYLEIAALRKYHPEVPVLALTATATPDVVEDIMDKLEFRKRNLFKNSFERPNLTYLTVPTENKLTRIISFAKLLGGSGIVYANTRKKTRDLAAELQKNGVSADYYHAGLDSAQRKIKQANWINNKIRVIVATNAFGMGIDKPDVRFVLHYDIPENIENYFQEAGRGGRDLKKSRAILFYEERDLEVLKSRVEQKYPEKDFVRKVYGCLGSHFNLAFGAGKNQVYALELGDFCRAYDLDPMLAYNALQILERNEYIKLSEGIKQGLRIRILANAVDLYNFQIKYPEYEALLKLLLRAYTGIFDHMTAVDESAVMKKMNLGRDKLYKMLHALQKMELLEFKAPSKGPEIEWLEDRLDHNHLYIAPATFDDRKKDAEKRLGSMLEYLSNKECRSRFLLSYFGEENPPDCGKCNVCLNLDESRMDEYVFMQLVAKLEVWIRKAEKVQIDEIFFKFNIVPENDLKRAVQWLVKEDVAVLDSDVLYLKL